MVCYDTLCYFMVLSGTFWYFMVFYCSFCFLMVVMVVYGTFWYFFQHGLISLNNKNCKWKLTRKYNLFHKYFMAPGLQTIVFEPAGWSVPFLPVLITSHILLEKNKIIIDEWSPAVLEHPLNVSAPWHWKCSHTKWNLALIALSRLERKLQMQRNVQFKCVWIVEVPGLIFSFF